MRVYSNNGFTMRLEAEDYQAQEGEWIPADAALDTVPAEEDLQGAFPGRAALVASTEKEAANSVIQAQMDALDGGGQARAIRGAVLAGGLPASDDLTRLQALEAQVAALRATLR